MFSPIFNGEDQRVNFQPLPAPTPPGYQVDDGSYYLIRGEWGWITDDDEDGLPDWWEILHFGTLDYDADDDVDADGLANLDEHARGMDPSDDDTDGDGWRDGYEVDEGSDPTSGASYPSPGLVIFSPEDGCEI